MHPCPDLIIEYKIPFKDLTAGIEIIALIKERCSEKDVKVCLGKVDAKQKNYGKPKNPSSLRWLLAFFDSLFSFLLYFHACSRHFWLFYKGFETFSRRLRTRFDNI